MTTTDRDLDRALEAWLRPGATRMPARTLATLADRLEATPQRRVPRLTMRLPTMTPTLKLGMAAAAALAVGLALVPASQRSDEVAPSPSPAVPVSPVPPEIRSKWVTDYRQIEPLPPAEVRAVHLELGADSLSMDLRSGTALQSTAGLAADGETLVLTSLTASPECAAGVTGTYTVELSTAGPTTLTLTPIDDPCTTRAAALSPLWTREGCGLADGGRCLGPLPAGSYGTVRFQPRGALAQPSRTRFDGLTYTLPDGWASVADWGQWTGLATREAYDAWMAGTDTPFDMIRVLARPAAADLTHTCEPFAADLTLGRSYADIVSFIRTHPALTVSDPVPVTIGGRPGTRLDIDVAPSWTSRCPPDSDTSPFVPLLVYGWEGINPDGSLQDGIQLWGPGGIPGETHDPVRLEIVDLGSGDVAIVLLDSGLPADQAAFVERAAPIVESFRIAG